MLTLGHAWQRAFRSVFERLFGLNIRGLEIQQDFRIFEFFRVLDQLLLPSYLSAILAVRILIDIDSLSELLKGLHAQDLLDHFQIKTMDFELCWMDAIANLKKSTQQTQARKEKNQRNDAMKTQTQKKSVSKSYFCGSVNNNCEDFALYCKTSLWSTDKGTQGRSSQANMVRPTRHVKKDKDLVERVTRNATSVPISLSNREDKDLGHRKDVVKVPVEDLSSFRRSLNHLADGGDNGGGSGCMMLAKVAEELNGRGGKI
nr:putative endopeptidase, NLPC/P60 domain, LRAT-like domain protein [Tanacetum cinerariifolium]